MGETDAAVPGTTHNIVRETFAYYVAESVDGFCKIPRRVADDMAQSYVKLEARALAAEAALAGEREPNVEIRRNDDGSIDEVVAKGVTAHLEQMEAGAWFLGLDAGEQTWQFWLRAKNPKTRVDIYHEQSAAAAIRAQGA